MIIKFKAFVSIKDNNGWRRITESTHKSEKEAYDASIILKERYKDAETGIHKYYIFSCEEWKHMSDIGYTGISHKDGKTKTWMTDEGHGCVLLFEGIHFEIAR